MSKIDTSVLNEHKKPINKYEKLLLNCMSCPEIAIHKNSVYGKPRTRNLCFEGAQAEPL